MKKYYFTFGSSENFPHRNGWVVIHANSLAEAQQIFINHYPCRRAGVLNCAFYYTEDEWNEMQPEKTWHGYKCYGEYTE